MKFRRFLKGLTRKQDAVGSFEKDMQYMTIPEWQVEIHKNAVAHGWWDTVSMRPVPEILCLIHSEVSEALEAFRKGDDANFAEELADVAIRLFDAAEGYGVNLEKEIAKKHEYNRHRSYRHGGKHA